MKVYAFFVQSCSKYMTVMANKTLALVYNAVTCHKCRCLVAILKAYRKKEHGCRGKVGAVSYTHLRAHETDS